MAPTIIFDKSAFQTISRQEHMHRLFRFHECITPVLLVEILADLAKTKPLRGKGGAAQVQVLARKFLGSGGVVCVNVRELVHASLDGFQVPMSGQIPTDNVEIFEEEDGSFAELITPGPGNAAVIRWARGVFDDSERTAAAVLRDRANGFSPSQLRRGLDARHVVLPRASKISGIAETVDDLLAQSSLQHALLDWALEQFPLAIAEHNAVIARWNAGPTYLEHFAPYAYHCVRTLLCLLVGTLSKVLTQRPTNRIDVEYLFYSPFAEVFVSGDRLHAQLYPMVSSSRQVFIAAAEFKSDLQRLAAERQSLAAEEVARRDFAFGSRPWPAKGSVLWQAWRKLRGPWESGSGNRAVKLSEEERRRALEEAAGLVAAVEA